MNRITVMAFTAVFACLALPALADGDPDYLEKKAAADAARQQENIDRKVWLDTRQNQVDRVQPMDVMPLVKGGDQSGPRTNGKIVCEGREGSGWSAHEGKRLQEVLQAWAACEGWTVHWQTDRQYVLQASATFPGTFLDAAGSLIGAFERADPPAFGEFHAPNKVLVVTTPTELDGQ